MVKHMIEAQQEVVDLRSYSDNMRQHFLEVSFVIHLALARMHLNHDSHGYYHTTSSLSWLIISMGWMPTVDLLLVPDPP